MGKHTKNVKRETAFLDYWQAHWPIGEFITEKAKGTTKVELAKRIGTGDVTMHLWGKKGFTPLSAFKACMVGLVKTPAEREQWENKLVLVKAKSPAYCSNQTKVLAQRFDEVHIDRAFPIKGGGKHIIKYAPTPPPEVKVATVSEAEVVKTAAPVLAEVVALPEPQELVFPTPLGDIRMLIPARPVDSTREVNELLIQMSQRILAEKETAERMVVGLRSQVATMTMELSAARATLQKQAEELKLYEELLSGAEQSGKGTLTVAPEVRERTGKMLKDMGAHSLSLFLDSLPKPLAHS